MGSPQRSDRPIFDAVPVVPFDGDAGTIDVRDGAATLQPVDAGDAPLARVHTPLLGQRHSVNQLDAVAWFHASSSSSKSPMASSAVAVGLMEAALLPEIPEDFPDDPFLSLMIVFQPIQEQPKQLLLGGVGGFIHQRLK
jgi:hypothetical protein